MKRLHNYRFLGILYLAIFSISCSSDLDFSQTKNLRLEPTYIANLVYFDIPVNEFLVNGNETLQFKDFSTVAIFNNTFFKNDLVKADLDFEISNTINRGYTIEVKMLNSLGFQIDSIIISVPAYSGVANSSSHKEVFSGTRLAVLKNTKRIETTITMMPGVPVTSSSTGTIKMRSGITAYFVIQ